MQRVSLCLWALLGVALAASAQPAAPTNTLQSISLDECIHVALLHNRALQIQRFEPELARMTLEANYGAYDPVFSGGYDYSHLTDSGSFNPSTFERVPVYGAQSHLGNVDLSGSLPIGMTYDVSGNYNNTWGRSGGFPLDSFVANVGAKLTQHLLRDFWTDGVRTSIQVNKRNLKITELGVSYAAMDIITQVRKAYYELIYAHDFVKVEEKLLEVRQRFFNETRQKIALGKLAPLDEKLAQSQLVRVQADLISSRNRVSLAENQLKALLGDNFVSSVGHQLRPTDPLVVVPETFEVAASWRMGMVQRPDLQQLRLDVEKAELDRKYRYNQLFPTLDVVAGYGLKGADQLLNNNDGTLVLHDPSSAGAFGEIRGRNNPNDLMGIIFSVPLSRTTDKANYKTSKLRKAQAEVLLKQREEVILRDIDDAIKTARSSLEKVTAAREATEYAKAALDAEEKKLGAGTSTAFVVLQLQGELASAAVDELRAKADYNIAVAQLQFVEGSVLERGKISIEVK
jgi:outer membrane protein